MTLSTLTRNLIPAVLLLAASIGSALADSRVLYYNKTTGGYATTTLAQAQAPTVLSAGTYFADDTQIVPIDSNTFLLYNSISGAAVVSQLNNGVLSSPLNVFQFSSGWSHIISMGDGVMFYNKTSGLAVTGRFNASTNYGFVQYPTILHFAAGWTNITFTDSGRLLFYNSANGSAAVGMLNNVISGPGFGTVSDKVFHQIAGYAAGSFTTGWTHITETHHGILFYRKSDGLMAMTDVNGNTGVISTRANSVTHLAPGFTSVVADQNQVASLQNAVLFYNATNGDVALGHVVLASPGVFAQGIGTVQIDLAMPGMFSTGWTSLVNVIEPVNVH